MKRSTNPVFYSRDSWWFWNETWSIRHGPYSSKEEAAKKLKEYCLNELGLTAEQIGVNDGLLEKA